MNLLIKPAKALQRLSTFTLMAVATFLMLQGCTKERLETTSERVYVQTKDVYHVGGATGDSIVYPDESERWTIYMRGETEVNGASNGLNYFIFCRGNKVIIQGGAYNSINEYSRCIDLESYYVISGKDVSFRFLFRPVDNGKYLEFYFGDTDDACSHMYFFERK